MTPHNRAYKGEYADIVLMPGDPLRAKWIAETFLSPHFLINDVRNCLGYTGSYKNKRISVQAGGMGMPSNAIYIHELYNFYGVETIIRVGSAGGISENVMVGNIVAATSAITDSNMTSNYNDSSTVTKSLLDKFIDKVPDAHVGTIISSDYFYNPNEDWWIEHQQKDILAVEMETHILYHLVHKFNKQALTVCTISDHLDKEVDSTNMTSQEREKGFSEMVKAVLEIC